MKKVIKGFIISIIIVLIFIFILLFYGREYHIKTEYGDSFTIRGGGIIDVDAYCIIDDNSDFIASIDGFERKCDFMSICDSDYFRCYRIKNETQDMYILKIKKYDSFFTISKINEEYTEYLMSGKQGEIMKSEFLCDSTLMEICLPYLDKLYHYDIITIAKNMIEEDFENLNEYGLTEEMVNDKDSLEEKIEIIEHYRNSRKN